MIHVVAVVTAKPGQRDAFLALLQANLAAVRAEDGCIAYQPAIDLPDMGRAQTKYGDDTVVVLEAWASVDALTAHGAAPHMAAFSAATKELVASRAIHMLSPV